MEAPKLGEGVQFKGFNKYFGNKDDFKFFVLHCVQNVINKTRRFQGGRINVSKYQLVAVNNINPLSANINSYWILDVPVTDQHLIAYTDCAQIVPFTVNINSLETATREVQYKDFQGFSGNVLTKKKKPERLLDNFSYLPSKREAH